MKRLLVLALCVILLNCPLTAGEQQPDWFVSTRGEFSVRIPGTNIRETPATTSIPRTGQVTSDLGSTSYAIGYTCFCEFPNGKVSKEKMDVVESALKSREEHKILSEKDIEFEYKDGPNSKKYPGRELKVETKTTFITYHLYVTTDVIYQVLAVWAKTGPTPPDIDIFFSSFQIGFDLPDEVREANGLVAKSEEIIKGKAIFLDHPQYPEDARSKRITGKVEVEIEINEEGKVISAQPICGHPLLVNASVSAALKSRFRATLLRGAPAKVVGKLTYNYKLG